ncbi:MAG: hypothetical protein WBW16_03850 [Bacteroidota bacterium]
MDTSLHQEMKQVFVDWVRGLRSIIKTPKDSPPADQKKQLTAQESGSGGQSDDEGGGQDDGGESG